MDCIFCKIIKKELSADIVFEDNNFIAFNDIHPKAPVHILIIPKEHIVSVNSITERNKELMGGMLLTAKKIAEIKGLKENGYRLIINTGKYGGQEVDHLHLHLLGESNA